MYIVIFVKTNGLQFSRTNIWTRNLDIQFWKDLYFEAYHMNLSAFHGSVTGIESYLHSTRHYHQHRIWINFRQLVITILNIIHHWQRRRRHLLSP